MIRYQTQTIAVSPKSIHLPVNERRNCSCFNATISGAVYLISPAHNRSALGEFNLF
jgi:hypothetical protein